MVLLKVKLPLPWLTVANWGAGRPAGAALMVGRPLASWAAAALSACFSSGCWVTLKSPQCERSGKPASEDWLTVTGVTVVGEIMSRKLWAAGVTTAATTSVAARATTSADRRTNPKLTRGRLSAKRGRGRSLDLSARWAAAASTVAAGTASAVAICWASPAIVEKRAWQAVQLA